MGEESGDVVDGVVADGTSAGPRSNRSNFDPKAFLDDRGVDLDRIGDEVKKATGFDVQAYIDEAKRRLDERGTDAAGTDAADLPEDDEPRDDQDDDGKDSQG